MQPRLARLEPMLGDALFDSILWGHEYDLTGLDAALRRRIESGHFQRIVFYGMGCSSVVSDIVKGFFRAEGIPLRVDVVNDYDYGWFVDRAVLADDTTLVIIVCYSGWSVEPCLFYDTMGELTGRRNLLVLSGGGRIAGLCRRDGTSLIQYRLRQADREYPLYHVQQFFSIFLDLFAKLGIIEHDYRAELANSVAFLKAGFGTATRQRAREVAGRLADSRIVLLSTADWYVALLKQTAMFFNEIAMVPTSRNLLHEYSHTEVAAYSEPEQKQSLLVFRDAAADEYTLEKIRTLEQLFGDKSVPQNRNIEFVVIDLEQDGFFQKFFHAHFFSVYVAYYLGLQADVTGRDLISIAAKNPWWSQRSIEQFPLCVDIPSSLEPRTSDPAVAG